MKKNTVPFSAPLNEKDTELNTFGCRANNPWKKQYQKLLAEKEASK